MDCPIYSAVDADGLALDVFPRFFRVSTDAGDILAEYGAAHVRRLDAGMIPADKLPPGGVPRGALMLDRYGGMKPSKRLPIPFGVLPEMDGGALRRAILAMKPANVAHMQNDDNGCGPAVVAHVAGMSYAEAVKSLFSDGRVRITGTQKLANATGTRRHPCKSRTWEEALEHKAVAVLIKNMDPRLGRHYGHFVSVDPGAVIVDPELVLPHPLAEYPRREWKPLMYFSRT